MARSKPFIIPADLFIKRDFQINFVVKIGLLTLIGGILFSGLLLYFSRGTLTTSFHDARLMVQETSIAVLPAVVYTNLIMLFLSLLVTGGIIFYLTRKIVMPLFRFEYDIKAIGEGDLTTKIKFRTQDQTTVLAQNLNLMTTRLNGKIRAAQTGMQALIESASVKEVPEELILDLIRVHRHIGRLFKL